MKNNEKLSFCRICMGHCGVKVTLDERGQLADIRGDHDDPQTLGYACFKGLKATEAHNSPDRILHPLKRMDDGSFAKIPLEQALDEIAEKIRGIVQRDGAEAIAGYKGGGAFFTSSSSMMLNEFLKSVGSPKAFSSVTIDQSAKAVCAGRIGIWPAGRVPFNRGDVFMIVGGNPLVSVATNGFDTRNPMKRLKQARDRGMKLIVIDPRHTETAKFADVFVQPLPGEDSTILAGMIHLVLQQGWEDKEFCQRYAGDLDRLKAAVETFTPSYVANRADISEDILWQATELFAKQCSTGAATSATGPDMSPHSNLSEHLVECLNVICGRFVREGEPVDNPGAIAARWPRKAEVMPAPRWWEQGYKSRVGDFGLIDGELPTGTLADEILQPGEGQVKCLLVHGGNPASAIPDQDKIVSALRSLELLVTIDPVMTVTARLSDYILPPTMQYERPDLPLFIYENLLFPVPFTRYTPAISQPPAGSEVVDDAKIFWRLAQRLDLPLEFFGIELDRQREPEIDELLAIAARHAPIDFEELKKLPRGVVLDDEPQYVEAGDPDSPHRFSLAPDDVVQELLSVAHESYSHYAAYPFRLAVRRMRDAINSAGLELPSIKARLPYNLAYLNPQDLKALGVQPGDDITIESDSGKIMARAEADETVRSRVISIAHGFGGLPEEDDYEQLGVSTNRLVSLDRDCQTINAMPRMSGIPVRLSAVAR